MQRDLYLFLQVQLLVLRNRIFLAEIFDRTAHAFFIFNHEFAHLGLTDLDLDGQERARGLFQKAEGPDFGVIFYFFQVFAAGNTAIIHKKSTNSIRLAVPGAAYGHGACGPRCSHSPWAR